AEVDAEHVAPIQVREDLVRVGRFLAIWIGAGAVAGAEEDVGHGADRAVSEDPINREAAWKGEVAVVGGEDILPGGLHADVGRECAVCRRCVRSEEHTSELQSRGHLVCRLLLEKKKKGVRLYGTVAG